MDSGVVVSSSPDASRVVVSSPLRKEVTQGGTSGSPNSSPVPRGKTRGRGTGSPDTAASKSPFNRAVASVANAAAVATHSPLKAYAVHTSSPLAVVKPRMGAPTMSAAPAPGYTRVRRKSLMGDDQDVANEVDAYIATSQLQSAADSSPGVRSVAVRAGRANGVLLCVCARRG